MSPNLILGPLLRYAGARDATVWVEIDAACEVEVLVGNSLHRSHTFEVEGHHYALVRITGLKPGSSHEYAVALDGEKVWPEEGDPCDPEKPPGEEVANFEEYTRLYWDSWKEPTIRWFLSTVPTVMIFDDHDVHDDWNTSGTWLEKMRSKPWWEERIVGAFMSYWIYQHLGNLSPEELEEYGLFERVHKAQDASRVLREFAYKADRETGSSRWSFHRDFGRVRLIVMDTRAGRVLEEGHRSMLDREEWTWIEAKATGDFDHLLLGTTLPVFLAPGLHHLEGWNEAVCGGAWGSLAAKLGEFVRQLVDLEHWAAARHCERAHEARTAEAAQQHRASGDGVRVAAAVVTGELPAPGETRRHPT